jgi:hypothetical protein
MIQQTKGKGHRASTRPNMSQYGKPCLHPTDFVSYVWRPYCQLDSVRQTQMNLHTALASADTAVSQQVEEAQLP